MSGVQKQTCPECNGDCKLLVDLDTGMTAKLDDRLMALSPMDCRVVCTECGHKQEAVIHDLDVNLETGKLEFGQIEFL